MAGAGISSLVAPIIVVMGVAGSGKTTIGPMLADALGYAWLEGDALHSTANIEAMTRGVAAMDADRAPWLSAIHDRMVDAFERGRSLVVGCSALRESYRTTLSEGLPVTWVYLKGSAELIRSRLLHRTGHFMAAAMLDSQFDTLEEPHEAIVVDISLPPRVIVEHILASLGLHS
jgi:gluconokinase